MSYDFISVFFLFIDFEIFAKKLLTEVEGEQKKSTQGQNFAINEKSTIVVQSLRNLVKIFIS